MLRAGGFDAGARRTWRNDVLRIGPWQEHAFDRSAETSAASSLGLHRLVQWHAHRDEVHTLSLATSSGNSSVLSADAVIAAIKDLPKLRTLALAAQIAQLKALLKERIVADDNDDAMGQLDSVAKAPASAPALAAAAVTGEEWPTVAAERQRLWQAAGAVYESVVDVLDDDAARFITRRANLGHPPQPRRLAGGRDAAKGGRPVHALLSARASGCGRKTPRRFCQ